MKRLLVLLAVVAFAVSVLPASAQSLLMNGSFEESGLAGWTADGGGSYYVKRDTQEPQDGAYIAKGEKGWYSGGTTDGILFQNAALSGAYDLALTGLAKRYVLDGGFGPHHDWGWLAVDLVVDGVAVQTQQFAADDTWNAVQLAWSGDVVSEAGVAIRWGLTPDGANGGTKTFDMMLADSFDLTATAVPEPASMLALLGGLAGLVIKRKK